MIAIKIHETIREIYSFNPWKMVRAGEQPAQKPFVYKSHQIIWMENGENIWNYANQCMWQ